MKASSWHKYQAPLLTTADLTRTIQEGEFTGKTTKNGEYKGIFGPGHNSFTVDEEGNDILVYHARTETEIVGDPLYNPYRHAMLMKFGWEDDKPVFKF